MSVLGGRKKQKFTFNPRVNTTWSQDANKFGQKMLERMGWKSGQGLGKIFLQSLNKSLEGEPINTSVNDVPLNSFEKKSERSRVRVHYRKVTRGKDISQYFEKDLANIFCRKNLKNVNEKMQEKIDAEINGGHMDSYFKHKMENKQSKHSADDNSTNLESFSYEITTKKSKNEVSKPSFVSYLDASGNGDIKNKKKRKKFKECSDNSVFPPSKKFRSVESEDSGVGIVNPAFESLGNNVTVKMEAFDTIQESSTHIDNKEVEENSYEVKINKKKKKKSVKKLGSSEKEDLISVQIKSDENVDCDIMLNVTNEPVKTNANKDFFNDVHSKIQNNSRRKKKRVSEPEEHLVIGDLESKIDDHERHEEGVMLSFKKFKVSTKTLSSFDGSYAKKSYKHLIRGDLLLHFKNSNLYEVGGYGKEGQ